MLGPRRQTPAAAERVSALRGVRLDVSASPQNRDDDGKVARQKMYRSKHEDRFPAADCENIEQCGNRAKSPHHARLRVWHPPRFDYRQDDSDGVGYQYAYECPRGIDAVPEYDTDSGEQQCDRVRFVEPAFSPVWKQREHENRRVDDDEPAEHEQTFSCTELPLGPKDNQRGDEEDEPGEAVRLRVSFPDCPDVADVAD